MKFSENEISIAKRLHDLNLPWEPRVGNYVYDLKGIIDKSSPFQQGVYFILDLKHFIRYAGSVEGIKKSMCWLPLWEDCRNILINLGVNWKTVQKQLIEMKAFENNQERGFLYKIILENVE